MNLLGENIYDVNYYIAVIAFQFCIFLYFMVALQHYNIRALEIYRFIRFQAFHISYLYGYSSEAFYHSDE